MFTEVQITEKGRSDLPPIVVINVHFPRRDARLATRRWRCRRALRKRIRHYVERGFTVFWMGDTNTINLPKMHRRERVLAHRGLDHIRVIPGDAEVTLGRSGQVDLTIDGHEALWARVRISTRVSPPEQG